MSCNVSITIRDVSSEHFNMGQVTELWLSCYLVLLSVDSKTRKHDSRSFVTWPICSFLQLLFYLINCMVNSSRSSETSMHQIIRPSLVQIMSFYLSPVPSHYFNQKWHVFNCILRCTFQWNMKENATIYIQEIDLKMLVCKMASILSRPQCFKTNI